MNKKLISMAVGAALAAGTVVAQAADDAMPTVYGKIHVSYGAVKDEYKFTDPNAAAATPTFTDADNIQTRSHASRIGVKGAIPINDTLSATYKLEYSTSIMGSSNPLGNRNQYAGLKGGFGEFRFGRHDTPTKSYQGKFDEFNDTDADIKGRLAISRGENRINNVIAYLSPDFQGFTFAAAIAPGEGNGCQAATNDDSTPSCDANKGGDFGGDGPADIISLAAGYKMAGLFVSLGYDQYDKKADPSAFPADFGDLPDYLDGASAGGDYKDLMRLVATYKMDMFGVGGLYETSSGNKDNYGGDKDVMGISGHVSLAGGHKIKLQYMMGETDFNVPDNGASLKIGKNEETQISLGYDFKMGKSTTAYAIYTQGEDKTSIDAQYGGEDLKREYSFIGIGMVQNF
jgi:predicted porin